MPVLDRCGASAFAVSNINEAIKIRELGVKKPLLILGYTPEDMAKAVSYLSKIPDITVQVEANRINLGKTYSQPYLQSSFNTLLTRQEKDEIKHNKK